MRLPTGEQRDVRRDRVPARPVHRLLVPVHTGRQAAGVAPLVADLATAGITDVVLLHPARGARRRPAWLTSTVKALERRELAVRVLVIEGDDVFASTLDAVATESPDLLVVGTHALEARLVRRYQRLMANPPVATAVLAEPLPDDRSIGHVVVAPQSRAGSLALAAGLASTGCRVTLLGVDGVSKGAGKFAHHASGIRSFLAHVGRPDHVDVRITRARSLTRAIRTIEDTAPPDLVITDAASPGLRGWLVPKGRSNSLAIRRTAPVVTVARPAPPVIRSMTAVAMAASDLLPNLSERDKVAIYMALRRAARGGVDFSAMVILSTAIAALGLLMNNPVVIVGAMLVAPLMTPIMSLGLGITQGDQRVVRLAGGTIALGAATAVAVGAFVGLVHPNDGITAQMETRAQPTITDLLVAIVSGGAGAYAACRRNVASSLAGVAIAVALVPPLATVGLGMAFDDRDIATGAGLLFLVNLAAISGAASFMFLWLGFRARADRAGRPTVFARGAMSLGGVMAAIVIALIIWQDASESRLRLRVRGAADDAVHAVDAGAEVVDFELVSSSDTLVVVELSVKSRWMATEHAGEIQGALARELEKPVELTVRIIPAETVVPPSQQDGAPPELTGAR